MKNVITLTRNEGRMTEFDYPLWGSEYKGVTFKVTTIIKFDNPLKGIEKDQEIDVEWISGTLGKDDAYYRTPRTMVAAKFPSHSIEKAFEYKKQRGKKWYKITLQEYERMMGYEFLDIAE